MRDITSTPSIAAGQTMGVDLGDRFSQVCVLDGSGATLYEGRVSTSPAHVESFFKSLPRMRVAMEAGTHSRWVGRIVAACGHEVIVANPRKVRLIGHNQRKSDRADALRLAQLARTNPDWLGPIQHRGEQAQQDLAVVRSRDALVQSRTLLVNRVRGTLKSFAVRPLKCSTESFAKKIAPTIPDALKPSLLPLLELLFELNVRIARLEHEIERIAQERYPVVDHLGEIKGVGPITALTYVLTIEDPRRFTNSRDVAAFLGIVPRQRQSGERDPQLHITKTGDTLARRLLVGAAHYILGPFGPDCDLRRCGLALAARGGVAGKKRALVAVARKLAVVLHRLWVTGEVYDPQHGRRRAARAQPVAA
jgi:transposase